MKKYISNKRIKVNEKIILKHSHKLTKSDKVYFDNKIVIPYHYVYIILNKPKNYVSANIDKKEKTALSLIDHIYKEDLSIAGRLDKDSHGLLLLTNDGNFIHQIISPEKEIYKTYKVKFEGELSNDKLDLLKSGINLGDFISKPAIIEIISKNEIIIKIYEGKFHQIKRMMKKINLNVTDLQRIAIGNLRLEKLNAGEYKEISYSLAKKALNE